MEISASPIHTQSLSRSPWAGVDNWNQWKRASTTISQIDTQNNCSSSWTETEEDGGVFGSPSVERVFYFVSLFFYFNFYFNWNNIIPRSSHELSLTQRQHTSCANGVRLFGFELGLLVSATVAGCLSRSRSPHLPVSRSSLLLYPCRSLNRAEGIVNYPIVYCGNGKED